MTDLVAYQGKIAGAALVLSLVSIGIGLIIIGIQGKFGGLAASFSGVEGFGDRASALSTIAKAGIPLTLLQVVGFGILAVMLREEGEASISTVSFGLLILSLALSVFRGAFDGTVTVWAAEQSASSGNVPDLFEPLKAWVGFIFGIAYVGYFVAMAGFGWGVLRAGILPAWVGWATIGWSVLWVGGYVFNVGLPVFIVIPPLIFGIALLMF